MGSQKSKDRLIVYVDGFNLYFGLHAAAKRELLWLDLVALAKHLRPESALVQVKYFTAMVQDEPDAQSRQDRYISAQKSLYPGRFTVVMGKYMRKKRRCRECEAQWTSYEEKQTDVNLAVHLVADVAGNRADTYMVVTGDTDVIPALKMARSLDPNATLIASFPPRRSSDALKRMLPSSRELTLATLSAAQLPDVAIAPNGKKFHRPEKWAADQEEATVPPPETEACAHGQVPTPATVAKLYRPPPQ
jgi:uncharacterized LabA/DUF88 family protein